MQFKDHSSPGETLKVKRQRTRPRKKDTCGRAINRSFSNESTKNSLLRPTNRRFVPLEITVGSTGSSKPCSPSEKSSKFVDDVVVANPPNIATPDWNEQCHSSSLDETSKWPDKLWNSTNSEVAFGSRFFGEGAEKNQCETRRSYFQTSVAMHSREEESEILAPDTPEHEYGVTMKMRQLKKLMCNLFPESQ